MATAAVASGAEIDVVRLPDAPEPEAQEDVAGVLDELEDVIPATTDNEADWIEFGSGGFLRRWRMFNMGWSELDLGSNTVTAGPHGGPIVVAPQRGAFSMIGGLGSSHEAVRVYTGSGQQLGAIEPIGSSAHVITAGMTAGCRVVILRADGAVDLHTPLGQRLRASFSLPDSAASEVGSTARAPALDDGVLSLGAAMGGSSSASGRVLLGAIGHRALAAIVQVKVAATSEADGDGSADGDGPAVATRVELRLVICADLDCEKPSVTCSTIVDDLIARRQCPASMALLDRDGDAGVDVVLGTSDFASPGMLLASEEGGVVRVLAGGHELGGVAEQLSVSPEGSAIAALCSDDVTLRVFTSSLEERLLELDIPALLAEHAVGSPGVSAERTPMPTSMAWLGEQDGLVLHWSRWGCLVVPQDGATSVLEYPSSGCVLSEIDGARVLTAKHHDLLAAVSDASLACRRDVTRPGSRLVNAQELFDRSSPGVMGDLRALEQAEELEEAVSQCLFAAEDEHASPLQQGLLRAASLGVQYMPSFDATRLTDTCRRVRVLNALRRPAVGVGLTALQLDALSPEALVSRLAQLHQHGPALRICRCLGLAPRFILEHWAAAKVARCAPADEEEVLRDIVSRLRVEPGISFADIAAAAHASGRPGAAKRLLLHEPRKSRHVPLLLQMREGEAALETALRGGSVGLVALVLSLLRERLVVAEDTGFAGTGAAGGVPASGARDAGEVALAGNQGTRGQGGGGGGAAAGAAAASSAGAGTGAGGGGGEGGEEDGGAEEEEVDGEEVLFRLLRARPQAMAMAESQLREEDAAMLQRLYHGTGRWLEAAKATVEAANRSIRLSDRLRVLDEASKELQRGIDSGKRELEGLRAVVETQKMLLAAQAKLEEDLSVPRRFVGTSLAETVAELIRLEGDGSKRVRAVVHKFKMPESRFWLLRIEALASERRWEDLVKLGNSKRSPVGYVPFVRACLDSRPRAVLQATKLCAKVDDLEQKLNLLIECEAWDECAETAKRIGDPQAAISVLSAMGIRGSKSDARKQLEALASSR